MRKALWIWWVCCSTALAVEPFALKTLSDTEVSVKGDSLQEALTALEGLLGKRVVLDSRAKDIPVNIQTATPLKKGEEADFAKLAVLAAGCGAIDTPTAFYICRREDRPEVLEALKEQAGKPCPPVTKQIVLHYAEVRDVLSALRQYAGGEQTPFAAPQPTSTKNEMKLENGQFKQVGSIQPATTNLASIAQPLQPMDASAPDSVSGFKIPGGAVTGDPMNRQVIIEGQEATVLRMAAVVKMLDVEPQQVMISATIGEYTREANSSAGVDWSRVASAMSKGSTFAASSVNGVGFPFQQGLLTQPGGIGVPTGTTGLAVYGAVGSNVSAMLTALETTNKFRVVQRPVIVTLNHMPGKIYIGEQVPIAGQTLSQAGISTATAAISSTTQYVPVRLEIDITPHVFEGGNIRLDIQEEHNDVSGYATISGNQVPNISEQGLKNTIILKDGAWAVLGGLSSETNTKTSAGLPGLARIPVLGVLFGHRIKATQRQELMIFVRPVICGEKQDEPAKAVWTASEMDLSHRFH